MKDTQCLWCVCGGELREMECSYLIFKTVKRRLSNLKILHFNRLDTNNRPNGKPLDGFSAVITSSLYKNVVKKLR